MKHPNSTYYHAADLPPRTIATGEGVQLTRALDRSLRARGDYHPLRGGPKRPQDRIARLRALAIERGEYRQAPNRT